jgi:hypothetical protein
MAIFAGLAPWLRGPSDWRWALGPATTAGRLAGSVLAAALLLAWWWLVRRRRSVSPISASALVVLVGLALLLQYSLLHLWPTTRGQYSPFAVQFERLISDQASGYFTVAQEIEHLPAFLREYPERMPTFRPDPHPRSKPPGIVLVNWGLAQLLEKAPALAEPLAASGRAATCDNLWAVYQRDAGLASNAVLAVLIPVLSALTIVPAYTLTARRLAPAAGWLAAGFVALMPGRLAFTPHMDTVYPFLALLALDLVDRGIVARRLRWTLGAGLTISIATFLSLVNVLIAALAGLWLLFRLAPWSRAASIRPFALHGVALVAGVLSLWIFYGFTSGVTPLDIYQAAAPARHDLARNYWLWLVANVYDFAVFAGLPAFLLALPVWRRHERGDFAALLGAFWLLFLALDASGIIRGEVGRIWLMLAPFPLLLAARHEKVVESRPALALLTASALLALAIVARWEVTELEWPRQPQARAVLEELAPATPLVAPFGPAITLRGYDFSYAETLDVTLYWQAMSRPQLPYTVFVHIVGPGGDIVAQQDLMPQHGTSFTTCWHPGEWVRDEHTLSLAGLPPGDYTVLTGLYDQASGVRAGEAVLIGDLSVSEESAGASPH